MHESLRIHYSTLQKIFIEKNSWKWMVQSLMVQSWVYKVLGLHGYEKFFLWWCFDCKMKGYQHHMCSSLLIYWTLMLLEYSGAMSVLGLKNTGFKYIASSFQMKRELLLHSLRRKFASEWHLYYWVIKGPEVALVKLPQTMCAVQL